MHTKIIIDRYKSAKNRLNNYHNKIKSDIPSRNRFLMLFLSSLFLFDYLLFCYITAGNPLDIFPSFPLLEDKKMLHVYLPDTDGKSILKESREISIPENKEEYAKILIGLVIKGSDIDNTSSAVPVNLFNRRIWFEGETCVIDFVPSLPGSAKNKKILTGNSEAIFRESLEKTITENIRTVRSIMLLERGIPGRPMWANSI